MSKLIDIDRLFNGRHFDREVIVLCVRWYLRYKLSLRDLVEIMAERGLPLAHTTIMRWVKRFAPEFVKRWNRFARSAGRSWRVDETYVKVRGKWAYLYRAVDRAGKTVDFRLSARRDVAAAKAFFVKAINSQGLAPKTITQDGYAASHRAVREMKTDELLPEDTTLRSSKYLNNSSKIPLRLQFGWQSSQIDDVTAISRLSFARAGNLHQSRSGRIPYCATGMGSYGMQMDKSAVNRTGRADYKIQSRYGRQIQSPQKTRNQL